MGSAKSGLPRGDPVRYYINQTVFCLRRLRNTNPSAWLLKFKPRGPRHWMHRIGATGAADLDRNATYLTNPGLEFVRKFRGARGD
jgi:hypothetical protein